MKDIRKISATWLLLIIMAFVFCFPNLVGKFMFWWTSELICGWVDEDDKCMCWEIIETTIK